MLLDSPEIPFGIPKAEFTSQLKVYTVALKDALHTEYREIFLITAVLCALGTALALALPGSTRADRG